jgi:hypothetical protein
LIALAADFAAGVTVLLVLAGRTLIEFVTPTPTRR